MAISHFPRLRIPYGKVLAMSSALEAEEEDNVVDIDCEPTMKENKRLGTRRSSLLHVGSLSMRALILTTKLSLV
jgi:chorismate-pyruvate lyase